MFAWWIAGVIAIFGAVLTLIGGTIFFWQVLISVVPDNGTRTEYIELTGFASVVLALLFGSLMGWFFSSSKKPFGVTLFWVLIITISGFIIWSFNLFGAVKEFFMSV